MSFPSLARHNSVNKHITHPKMMYGRRLKPKIGKQSLRNPNRIWTDCRVSSRRKMSRIVKVHVPCKTTRASRHYGSRP